MSTPTKVYVLMEIGYEYNDETYFRSNCEGGNPKKFFTNRKEAEAAASKADLDRFKEVITENDITGYGYSLDDVLSSHTTEDDCMYEEGIFMTLFGQTAEEWFGESNKFQVEPTEEQWQKLFDCFNLSFFEVVEVQKG